MGLRFRKSINLGCGLRINLSKSGIGYSFGVKGARITKTANGRTRTTLSIPGSGISYVTETGGKSAARNRSQKAVQDNSYSTENINIADHRPVEYLELLKEIENALSWNFISTILVWFLLLGFFKSVFWYIGIFGIVMKLVVHKRKRISMQYEFDDDVSERNYENVCQAWLNMNNNKRLWQITRAEDRNTWQARKASGGASQSVQRIRTNITNAAPWFISTNITPVGVRLQKKNILFLPDKVLIIQGTKVGAMNYTDLVIKYEEIKFNENELIPSDSQVIGHTWLKVNRDGSPDKRFKGNKQVSICLYGYLTLSSPQGLNIELMCSNPGIAKSFDEMRINSRQIG